MRSKSTAQRFLAAALAMVLCLGLANVGLLGGRDGQGMTKEVFAAESAGYEAGKTYYDVGSMTLDAYYDGADTSANTYQGSWKVGSLKSALGPAAVTLANTTDFGSEGSMTSVVDGEGGKLLADYKAGAPDGLAYRYIAKGETAYDAEGSQVVIQWTVKAWPEKQHRAVQDMAMDDLGVDFTEMHPEDIAKVWDSNAFAAAAPKWASGGSDFTKWNEKGNTSGGYESMSRNGHALVWSGSPKMMMAVSDTVPVKWGSTASGKDELLKVEGTDEYDRDENGNIRFKTDANRTAYKREDDTGKMTVSFKEMGDAKTSNINANTPNWADVLPNWSLLKQNRFETNEKSKAYVSSTYMTESNQSDIIGYLNANKVENDWFETMDGEAAPGKWFNTTQWKLPAFNTPGFFKSMFESTNMKNAFMAVKDGDILGWMNGENHFESHRIELDGAASGLRIYALETEAYVQPGGLWDGALNEDTPAEDSHIGDTSGDLYYGRLEGGSHICVSPNQSDKNTVASEDKYSSIWFRDEESNLMFLSVDSLVHAYHGNGIPTHYFFTFDQETHDLYESNPSRGTAGVQMWNETMRKNLVSTVIYSGYDYKGMRMSGTSALGGGEVFVNTQVPMELRYQVYFDLTADYQRAEGTVTGRQDVETPVITRTVATDDGLRTDVVPSSSATIKDVVTYSGLSTSGLTYMLTSELYRAEDFDGSVLKDGVEPIRSIVTSLDVDVAASGVSTVKLGTDTVKVAKAGTVNVVFEDVDTTPYDGKALVVRETIKASNGMTAAHGDANTASQVIRYKTPLSPVMRTSATSGTGSKYLDAVAGETVVDRVVMNALEPGEYSLSGRLFDKTAGAVVEGSEVTGEAFRVGASGSATETMAFTLSAETAAAVKGHELVVYETLYRDGEAVLVHEDAEDESQTVTVCSPAVSTVLTGEEGMKTLTSSDDIVLTDAITYTGLVPGNEYKIVSMFVDKATGEVVRTASGGEEAVVSKAFTASGSTYTAKAKFAFTGMEDEFYGKGVVAYNELYRVLDGEKLLVSERDLGNADQTVAFRAKPVVPKPAISTVATGKDGGKTLAIGTDTVIRDEVEYKDLTPGVEYTLTATVFDKTANAMVAGVEAKAVFTPEAAEGKQDVEITLDTSAIDSHSLVVYETLSTAGGVVVTHADPDDTDQTVTVDAKPVSRPSYTPSYSSSRSASPAIDTVAYGDEVGSKSVTAGDRSVVIDEVSYEYFSTGTTYTITGTIYNKTQKQMVDGVASVKEFKPDARSGKVTMTFTLDTTDMVGDELVVYEVVSNSSGYTVCSHKSATDADQTVSVAAPLEEPEVPLAGLATLTTQAADTKTGTKTMTIAKDASISDTVSYVDVTPDKPYVLVATVYDKATGKRIESIKEAVKEILPVGPVGGTVMVIPVDTTDPALAGKELVVVETLYDGDMPVGEHNDMNDAAQTVVVPSSATIDTVATDLLSAGKVLSVGDRSVIRDTVNYWYLTPGVTYEITGSVYNRTTGEAVSDIKPVTVAFTPAMSFGAVVVDIPVFDAERYKGCQLVVVETVRRDGAVVCSHDDLEDLDQTVYVTNIATNLTPKDTTGKIVGLGEKETLLDSIGFVNLTAGETYKVSGYVIDTNVTDETVTILCADGSETVLPGRLVAQNVKLLEAEGRSGYFTMDFTVDTRELTGHKLVAVEFISDDEGVVGRHVDLQDEKQTVTVRVVTDVQTGGDGFGMDMDAMFVGFMAALLLCVCCMALGIVFADGKRKF